MTKPERNAYICRLYQNGATMEEIRRASGLSRQRVQQILKQNGLKKDDRPSSKTGRDAFLGLNLSKEVKDALRQEAERRGVSMSSLSADVLQDMLRVCGYPMDDAS